MALIYFGTLEVPIKIDEFFIKCPSCEHDSLADVLVVGKYFHIYTVPIFPTDKEATIVCKECGIKRHGINFDKDLIRNYEEIKKSYRYPLFTYIGLAVFVFIIASIIINAILKTV